LLGNAVFVFSGSHVVIRLVEKYPEYFVVNLDKVGYWKQCWDLLYHYVQGCTYWNACYLYRGGYVFIGSVCMSVYLYDVRVQNISKSYKWILMKFFGGVGVARRSVRSDLDLGIF